ncbi:MAG: dTMP kinase, partial [Dehalococcoidia bacterium]|nr:dTMP kinase [Dehalococcoidia bacterium]
MSLFITFEGGEGCGKSYQSRALYRWLSKLAVPVILIHEPGGTPLGEKVRRLLKRGNAEMSSLTELLLFNASRSQLVTGVIQPSLKKGKVVICDRFADSTLAYQGYGRGLDLDVVREVNRMAAQGLTPDLTVLLDVPVEVGLARKNGGIPDRFEREDIAFHHRVRDGFLKLTAREPVR